MKKIIDNIRYDTDKAEYVAGEQISLHSFYRTNESLYRTSKGKLFLYGESSAGGKYGRSDGNTQWGGEDIIPMTPAEAWEWAQNSRNLNSADMEKIAEICGIEIVDA